VESEEVVETRSQNSSALSSSQRDEAVTKCGGHHRAGSGLRNGLRVTPGLSKKKNNRLDYFSSQPRSSLIARRMLGYDKSDQDG
jgi:hypothetical protein